MSQRAANRLELVAIMIARETLRYTPAGVPLVSLTLAHESCQPEAGLDRQVSFEIAAVAVDELARRIDRIALGTSLALTGFLAPRRRNARQLVLHLSSFEPLPPPVPSKHSGFFDTSSDSVRSS